MRALKILSITCGMLMATVAYSQQPASNVTINGALLSQQQLITLQQQLGFKVNPGNYLVNFNNGCWMNMDNGTSGCVSNRSGGNGGTYVGPGGSGEWNQQGDWSYRSNSSGMGVGGTADGCVYAGSWSNC